MKMVWAVVRWSKVEEIARRLKQESYSRCSGLGSGFMASLPRTLGMVGLTLLLIYSGVAWALEDCSKESDETGWEQMAFGDLTSRTPLPDNAARPASAPNTGIRCLTNHHEIDAILRPSTATSLKESQNVIRFESPLSVELTLFRDLGLSWKSPYLDWFASSSPPGFLSRYLLLSVFLI